MRKITKTQKGKTATIIFDKLDAYAYVDSDGNYVYNIDEFELNKMLGTISHKKGKYEYSRKLIAVSKKYIDKKNKYLNREFDSLVKKTGLTNNVGVRHFLKKLEL